MISLPSYCQVSIIRDSIGRAFLFQSFSMVNRRIHPQLHAVVLRSMLDPMIPNVNIRKVSTNDWLSRDSLLSLLLLEAVGGMSIRTQERAVKRLEQTGTLEFDTSKKGRPRLLNREVVDHIIWLVVNDASIILKTIQQHLQNNGYYITLPTIFRTLEREGFTYKRIKKRAMERSAYVRTEFIHRMADYGVEQLVWLDESAKDERTCTRSYGWGFRGKDAVVDAPFVRGTRFVRSLALISQLRLTC